MIMQDNEKKPALRFKGFTDPWEQRKLGEIAFFSKGVGYSKNDLCEEGTPIILYGRLYTKYETCIFDVDTFVKEKAGSVYSKGGEVIVPASGETAEDISIASVVVKPGILLGGDLNVVSPTAEYDSAFLALTISSGATHKYLSSLAQGKSVVHLHNADIQSVSAKFPTKREQEKIHLLFGKIDTLITLHQRKYEKLVNIKKSMLDKMFPQNGASVPEIRFKGFTDPWEQRKLGDITVELSEYATQELGLPLLTSSRSGLMYQDEYRDSRTTKSTETLFSVVPVGTCTYRHMSDDDVFHMNINTLEKGLVSREYPVFEASKGNNLEFLVQHINSSEEFKAFCAEQKKGGTRTRLYYNTLCQFTVRVPALKEQAQISQCLKKLDTLITLHQREHIKPILEVKRVKRNE